MNRQSAIDDRRSGESFCRDVLSQIRRVFPQRATFNQLLSLISLYCRFSVPDILLFIIQPKKKKKSRSNIDFFQGLQNFLNNNL